MGSARAPGGTAGRGALGIGLVLGMLVAAVLFFTVPGLTNSSLSNMGYWVDWANLASVALGLGALAALFLWPLLALLRSKPAAARRA